jgi:two-component system sensor histidine kinase KdpD
MEKNTLTPARLLLRFLVLTGAALLLVALFRSFLAVNETTVALVFLVLVLITASRWRLAYSVYISVLCALLYNFFFLPPLGRLVIADPRNWIALAAFLSSAVLVSHLAEREHQHADALEARRREVELLYEFSQQLLLQEDLRSLARMAPSLAASIFGLNAAAVYIREEDAVYYSDPRNELLPPVELKLASSLVETGVTRRDGAVIVPIALGMRRLGSLTLKSEKFSEHFYEAVGGLIAIALERAAAIERGSRLEAWREGERLRSALVDSVTHDLRTPLTAIRAAVTTLASQPELAEAERAELVSIVDEESARLDRLIGQAVEMAQLDAEVLRIQAKPQDVRELIETTVEEMQSLLRGREVEISVDESLPSVPMDRTLVHRVLLHLLENAVAYSAPASAVAVRAARDEYRLIVTVADRGQGIDPADQPFVFDKFFRGRNQAGRHSGTGMGLAIVRAILEAHGGTIELISKPGQGTEFTFSLPLAPAPAASDERYASRS